MFDFLRKIFAKKKPKPYVRQTKRDVKSPLNNKGSYGGSSKRSYSSGSSKRSFFSSGSSSRSRSYSRGRR